ncbi:transglutaminase domain-containing protein [Streptococcus halichoeri]|uniref:transglutaminase domain-containing protein n=1 Tax=Streptococcus halichoeri TaxID=254785 RepID=UPI001F34366E|nr:transglutaminase domain-containing protein [Streptococcus halichoeri]
MKRKTIGSYLALIAGLLSLTSLSVQAEDTYIYPSRQGDSYTNSYYHYPPRNYDARPYDYRRENRRDYRDSNNFYTYYQEEYRQLETEHNQLIATYKQLKASYDATKQASDSELRSLSQKWQELYNRFQILVRDNPVVGGNYAIENLKATVAGYNNRLASYQASQDFITSNQETLNRLDQLDAERKSFIANWYESDTSYTTLISNLQTTNNLIQELNSRLSNQQLRTYPFTTPLADLQSQQTEIEAQINQIERDKAAYKPEPRAYRAGAGSDSGARSRRQRRQAPESESKNVPLWHEMRNEGLDHSQTDRSKLSVSTTGRVDLTNISDLKTLQEQVDLAHYQRAKEIVFQLKRSDLNLTHATTADTDLSGTISHYVKEKLAVMPNTRGVTSSYRWQVEFHQNNDDLRITLMPTYYMTDAQYQEYDKHLKDWTAAHIHDSDTEIQKIDKIQDYIMTNYHYAVGKVGGHTVTGISVQTPYAFLKDKEAVCQAYAQLFKDMGRLAGLDVYYIQGYGDPTGGKSSLHAWNIVKVGDKYYHVDLTWNDTIDKTNQNHTYTLRGNNFMKQTHLWNVGYQISDEDYHDYPRLTYYNNGRHPYSTTYRTANYNQPVQANYRSASTNPFAYSEQRQPQATQARPRRSTANNSNTGVRYKIVFGREATLGRA